MTGAYVLHPHGRRPAPGPGPARRRAPARDARPYSVTLADQARASIGRVRSAWDWLGEALLPGQRGPHADRPVRPLDDDTRAARAAAHAADRLARHESLRRRITPGKARPAPANLEAITTRSAVVDRLTDLHDYATKEIAGAATPIRWVDPDTRHALLTLPCTWCSGAGVAQQPDGWSWPWPENPPACPVCWRGRISNPDATPCAACRQRGRCRCDRATLLVTGALDGLADLLDLLDVENLTYVDETLREVADRAARVAGAGRDLRRLPGDPPPECPVCGSRELHAEVASPDRREWSIRCNGPDCECIGFGCPCGMGTNRRDGLRHVWPAKTWDGPGGLADLLGVALPGTWSTDEYAWARLVDEAYAEDTRREAAARAARRAAREQRTADLEHTAAAALAAALTRTEHHGTE